RLDVAVRLEARQLAIEVARAGRCAGSHTVRCHQLVAVVQPPIPQKTEYDVPQHDAPPCRSTARGAMVASVFRIGAAYGPCQRGDCICGRTPMPRCLTSSVTRGLPFGLLALTALTSSCA